LVPSYNDVLAEHHPDQSGKLIIEFVEPTHQPEVIDARPAPEINGSRY
jgi:hypothetical protein